MRISDANKLIAVIREVRNGPVMSEVLMDVGDQALTAPVTTSAASDMDLKSGDQVFAVFNSSMISLIKDSKDCK